VSLPAVVIIMISGCERAPVGAVDHVVDGARLVRVQLVDDAKCTFSPSSVEPSAFSGFALLAVLLDRDVVLADVDAEAQQELGFAKRHVARDVEHLARLLAGRRRAVDLCAPGSPSAVVMNSRMRRRRACSSRSCARPLRSAHGSGAAAVVMCTQPKRLITMNTCQSSSLIFA
jgi:hypothetical protein